MNKPRVTTPWKQSKSQQGTGAVKDAPWDQLMNRKPRPVALTAEERNRRLFNRDW